MTKGILTTLALVALGGTAFAADLPSRKGPVYAPVAPIFTWTGFYVGVNAGAVFTDNNIRTSGHRCQHDRQRRGLASSRLALESTIRASSAARRSATTTRSEFHRARRRNRHPCTPTWRRAPRSRRHQRRDLDLHARNSSYLGTVRLRRRLCLRPRPGLRHRRSGLWRRVRTPRFVLLRPPTSTRSTISAVASDVEVGYTVGGGVEYAFTNNLSLKAEYLYYDLGKKNVPVNLTAFGPAGGSYVSRSSRTTATSFAPA